MESKPLTFQFTKAVKKSSVIQTSLNSSEKAEEVDFVKSVDDHGIESTKKRKEYVPLVIPLKKPKLKSAQNGHAKHRSPEADAKDQNQTTVEKSLDSVAAEEILQEAAEGVDAFTNEKHVADIEVSSSTIVQGATIGEVPTLDDYDSVPVEEFGKALLRGMGWRDGDGAGKKGESIGPFEAVVRPKGLGLGASVAAAQPPKPPAEGEEELRMVPGAYVVVTIGKEKGGYGQVSSLDGDGRALVQMAVSGNTSSLPEGALQLVTKKDYKRNSRVINQDKYNEYKEKQDREHDAARDGDRVRDQDRDRDRGKDRNRDKDQDRDRDRDRREERAAHQDDSRSSKHRRRDAEKDSRHGKRSTDKTDRSSGKSWPSRTDHRPWVRPHLRVRCIDQNYKKGRYYKEKLTVLDVVTVDRCTCEDASGRLLEDVPTAQLETVIPRKQPAVVMVVRGPFTGQVGEVVERDQRRCRAVLQLLPDRDLETFNYDDICEYTGSMEAFS